MNVRFASGHDHQRWNDFVLASSQSSFLQTWEWGEFQRQLGFSVWRIIGENDGSLQAVALLVLRPVPLFGRGWLYIPRGPIIAQRAPREELWKQLQKKFTQVARDSFSMFIRIDPAYAEATAGKPAEEFSWKDFLGEQGWKKAEREVQPRHTIKLDLSLEEEALMTAMHPKTRYNIRLAQRRGVRIRLSTDADDIESFLDLAHEAEKRGGFRYHPDTYYRTMLSTLGPLNMLEVGVADHEDDVLAVHLNIIAGSTVTYAHGASASVKRNMMAPSLLHWESIRHAKAAGMRAYDFFGVAPSDAPVDHPWAGVTRFKEGFGGKREDYIGSYDFVLEAGLYNVFSMARRVREALR